MKNNIKWIIIAVAFVVLIGGATVLYNNLSKDFGGDKLLTNTTEAQNTENLGFFSSLIFGVVFSIGWTPCVGAFLGSALMLATSEGKVLTGVIMLLLYSLGLGIPFFISAILIDKLRGAFTFIKKHYKIINTVCGVLLIIVGVLMATGIFGKFLSFLS